MVEKFAFLAFGNGEGQVCFPARQRNFAIDLYAFGTEARFPHFAEFLDCFGTYVPTRSIKVDDGRSEFARLFEKYPDGLVVDGVVVNVAGIEL